MRTLAELRSVADAQSQSDIFHLRVMRILTECSLYNRIKVSKVQFKKLSCAEYPIQTEGI